MSKNKSYTIGTRGSALALAQTKQWLATFQQLHPALELNLQVIKTTGDRVQDRFLSEVGGKGLFIKELEEALSSGEIDLAVHSAKDIPSHLEATFEIVCYPKRRGFQDVLISRHAASGLEDLPQNAVVGTASLRRRLQLRKIRPDLQFALLRGNIDTRLQKLQSGDFDAIVLAQAGLERLDKLPSEALALSTVPAPGQGALAIEALSSRPELKVLLAELEDASTRVCVEIERGIARGLNGDCNLPLGVSSIIVDRQIQTDVFLSNSDGSRVIELTRHHAPEDFAEISKLILDELWEEGAEDILEELKFSGNKM